MNFDLKEHSHKRLNIFTGEWVLVSPHRTKRPWLGKTETPASNDRPAYDPGCYLCPGNVRADGRVNEEYSDPFVFTNDFSALLKDTPEGAYMFQGLLEAKSQKGICRVICFSPLHNLTLPQMTENAIVKIIELWQREFITLAKNKWVKYVQVFENKGDIMGCSNPHPHGQIWSLNDVPAELVKETIYQKAYFEQHGKSLLGDYLQLEIEQKDRIICANDHFVALVPFWAVWPYEAMIVSRRHIQFVSEFTSKERKCLAAVIKQVTVRYDNLFNSSFPYSAGIHQAPVNDGEHPEWHWHMHFYPPLLRSASIKKFMVGYEMLAGPQRDITPEWAAERLRSVQSVHYSEVV